jgi:hypothetical protein
VASTNTLSRMEDHMNGTVVVEAGEGSTSTAVGID